MSSVALLTLAPQNGTSSVTVHCKTVQTHRGKYFRHYPLLASTVLWLQKQECTGLLIGGNREGAGTGSAGVASVQAGSQHIAIFTHFTEIPCTVVPAVLEGGILQMSGLLDTIEKSAIANDIFLLDVILQ